MSAGAPWSVKGIDPKAREIAKDLARRSGMTLGEWLNTMIMDGDEDEAVVTPLGRRPAPQPGEDRRGRMRRLDDAYQAAEYDSDYDRVTRAIEDLAARIESAEARSTLAVSGIDQAVSGLLARLEAGERDQSATSARLEHVAEDIREEQTRMLDRLRQVEREAAGPRSAEALRALETALGKIANQLYEGEQRTRATLTETRQDLTAMLRRVDRLEARTPEAEIVDGVIGRVAERLEQAEGRTAEAIRSLESSFAQLDERLRAAEGRLGDDGREGRLERLADELSARFDESRAELIRHFDAAAEGRAGQLERALGELGAQVGAAEQRSAQAIDKMGHEVLRIAQNLNRRMTGVEQASAQSVERVAQAVEQRMRRSDGAHAQALEKLGGEIARISEKLTERIVHAERRSAQAVDDVGERIGRLADKIEHKQERASSEIADRIRQSEERTARLLAEARETIDRSLARAEERASAAAAEPGWGESPAPAAVAPASAAAFGALNPSPAPTLAARAAATEALFQEPAPDFPAFPAAAFDDTSFPTIEALQAEARGHAAPAAAAAASAQSFDDFFAPEAPAAAGPAPGFDDFNAETDFLGLDGMKAPPRPPVSTKEAIDAARAAARLGVRNSVPGESGGIFGSKATAGGKSRLQERVDRESKREGSAIRKGLIATGIAVVAMSAGVWAYSEIVDVQGAKSGKGGLSILPHGLFDDAKPAAPLAAVALEPTLAPAAPADRAAAEDLYLKAKEKLDAGDDVLGVDLLTQAANLGLASAQYHLSTLYADGEKGLAKDPVKTREWLARAAEGGNPQAMFNLGMLMYEGAGGPKDVPMAVKWLRRSAELGLGDAQYNLAYLYEQGQAVPPDPLEALKWYLIAAKAGDADARAAADRVGQGLRLSQRRDAERAARAFEPETPAPAVLASR
jgi:localization factor PodJL